MSRQTPVAHAPHCQVLPPGASVSAQRNAIYFPHDQHVEPYVVLAAWCLAGMSVFLARRARHPGGPATAPAAAPGAGSA